MILSVSEETPLQDVTVMHFYKRQWHFSQRWNNPKNFMEPQKTLNSQSDLKVGGIRLPGFKATVWHENSGTEYMRGTDSELLCSKGVKKIQWRMEFLIMVPGKLNC